MANRKKLARQATGWLTFLAVLILPFIYLVLREEVVEVTAVAVTRGRVEQTVTAIAAGTVTPRLDAMVASESMGTVLAIPFQEGDRVEKGHLLVELDHKELDAQVTLAEANVRVGTSCLEQAKLAARIYQEVAATRVSQTTAQLELAQLDFERIKSLSEKKAVSQSSFDKAALALRVAKENHTSALASQRENLVRQEEIKSAEANMEQLEAAVAVAKASREKAFVRAPFAGVVARILVDVGEAVTIGMPLLRLLQDAECYVEAPFDEADAAQIRIGQKARINIDAYREVDFPGRVEFIYPAVSLKPDLSRTLDVKIRIEEGVEKFIPGMSADVTILVDEKDDVLYAPSEALIRERHAYVIENGRAVEREVAPGAGNWRTREILDGLRQGETLITSLSLKELRDGVKVRVVDDLEY